jgi:hypothetical protein
MRTIIQKFNNGEEVKLHLTHEDFFRRKLIVSHLNDPIMREKLEKLYESNILTQEKAELLNELFNVQEINEVDNNYKEYLTPLEDN